MEKDVGKHKYRGNENTARGLGPIRVHNLLRRRAFINIQNRFTLRRSREQWIHGEKLLSLRPANALCLGFISLLQKPGSRQIWTLKLKVQPLLSWSLKTFVQSQSEVLFNPFCLLQFNIRVVFRQLQTKIHKTQTDLCDRPAWVPSVRDMRGGFLFSMILPAAEPF